MKFNKVVAWTATTLISAAALTGCGSTSTAGGSGTNTSTANSPAPTTSKPVVLTVGATPVPQGEILNFIKPTLAKEGIDLEVKEFTDYVQPNRALSADQLDANYFQHVPYLDDYNKNNKTNLVPTVGVHFEPLGLYPGKSNSLSNIPDGATVAVPNDTTNEGRALLLLQDNGLLNLKDPTDLTATPKDIASNPHHLVIKEVEAASIPRVLKDVNYAVINGNYAVQAGFTVKDALVVEKADSQAAKTYTNYVVVRPDEVNNPAIIALDKAITSPAVKQFIDQKYQGSVIATFTTQATK